ncbi:hypothetical protein MLD38_007456 [Melastoma candidum]|uniref:Uncharacterized protein n=1 Tax=Melastoma candidum TaxID=119954 RepID=A0ACB9RRC1_9MYRT|nr:hypothetical protein MLD38_007456 [Melastoma candidum]
MMYRSAITMSHSMDSLMHSLDLMLSLRVGMAIFLGANSRDALDVADQPEFADRRTSYVVQGVNTTGFFVGQHCTTQQLQLNYLEKAANEVAREHTLGMQVHPYTYRSGNTFLHFNFNQDAYTVYDF